MVLTHWHIVVSQPVKQCITVDLFPRILANAVDFQKEHLLLHRHESNKTSRLSSAKRFVKLYKPTCPAFSAWLNTGSIRPLKVTGKAIMLCSMALPSKLCTALHRQSNVGSLCDCKPCRSLDLSVWVEILSGADSNHGTGPRRNSSVNSRSTLCLIERGPC